jgi:hypothetical protein
MTEIVNIKGYAQEWAAKELERVTTLIAEKTQDELDLEWGAIRIDVNSYDDSAMEVAMSKVGLKFAEKDKISMYASNGITFFFHTDALGTYMQDGHKNRLLTICNIAFIKGLVNSVQNAGDRDQSLIVREYGSKTGLSVDGFNSYRRMLKVVVDLKLDTESIKKAIEVYNENVANVDHQRKLENKKDLSTGISKLIGISRETPVDKEIVEAQIQVWQSEIENTITARTWGWEVEAPNPDKSTRVPAGVEAGSDGSVESYESDHDDCECDCSDCTYHECDCDNCDNRNDDPEHCGDDEYCVSGNPTEYRTVGGLIRSQHPGLKELLDQISDSEKNETAGTHIHVYAADLNAKQIAVVLAGYAITQNVWDVIAGRNTMDDPRCKTYAGELPGSEISVSFKEDKLRHVGKFYAVNTYNVTTERGTLEFRQMDCNFDFNRITLMAWMARGLVEIAKRGAKVSDFVGIKDINGFVELYAKFGYTTVKETDEIMNPLGSRYNQERTRLITV